MLDPSRELPMPHVTRITSLSQGHATLLHCFTKLSRFARESPYASPSTASPSPLVDERRHFQRWLEQWELAFTTFLSNAMALMSSDDVTHSRVLKANHLACTILASDAGPAAFEVFDAEFNAIVELAGAVLRSRYFSDSPQDTTSPIEAISPSPNTAGLDVKDPLYIVRIRCNHDGTRNQAAELLARFYQQEGS